MEGVIYEGLWNKGLIVSGTERRPDGELYKGFFHNKKRHGQGELYKDNTLISKGLWELGAF